MVATMRDVAERASVSIKTVSNVLNGASFVRPENRERVLLAVEELGYRMNYAARTLRSGRSGVVSLVIPDIRNAYFSELAAAIIDASVGTNVSLIVEQAGKDKDRELSLFNSDRPVPVDGVLYSAVLLGTQEAHLLDHLATPLVLLGERIFRGPVDHVTMRNIEGARAATEHLIALGRRRIVAFGAFQEERFSSGGLRLRGYREALVRADIPFDDRLLVPVSWWDRATATDAITAFLDTGQPFDAIVAFNDVIGLAAMRAIQDRGMRVPDDVAVIGFDNIDESRFAYPALSTIDPGKEEIARTALDFLLERIDSPEDGPTPREYLSDFRLIARASTLGMG